MGTPYVAELRLVSFNFAPKGWSQASGQILAINQSQALFSLLGTTYGGNGQTTFALPNLQGRVAVHAGPGYTQGQIAGEANHTLLVSELQQTWLGALHRPQMENCAQPHRLLSISL